MASPNLYDCAAVWRALTEQRPGWAWHVCDDPPVNGRYHVDHAESRLWLPGHLAGVVALRSFVEGSLELLHGDEAARGVLSNVIPLRRGLHRAGVGHRGRAV